MIITREYYVLFMAAIALHKAYGMPGAYLSDTPDINSNRASAYNPEHNSIRSVEPLIQEENVIHDDAPQAGENENTPKSDTVPDAQIAATEEIKENAVNVFAQKLNNQILFHNDKPEVGADKTELSSKNHSRTLIWSPFSVYQSLLPVLYAADGVTEAELKKILKPYQVDDISSNQAFSFATGLFTRDEVPLNHDYIMELQGKVRNVQVSQINFRDTGKVMERVNTWVKNSTRGLISEAIDKSQINPEMFMMIVNCVHFKAPWQFQFNPQFTTVSTFHGTSGPQFAQMMNRRSFYKLAEFPSDFDHNMPSGGNPIAPFKMLEVPYADSDLFSFFILPDSTADIPSILDFLTNIGIQKILDTLSVADVDLSLPKFKITSEMDMEDALIKNGLKSLFTAGQASLPKLFISRSSIINTASSSNSSVITTSPVIPAPYLSKIIHRTIFETSEEGTTAGAATSLSLVPLTALQNDEVNSFIVDRPFIVMLIKGDTIIFEGVVADLQGQIIPPENKNSVDSNNDNHNPDLIGEASSQYAINSDELSEDRTWWIPHRIPEYLKRNRTKNPNPAPASQPVSNEPSNEAKNNANINPPLPSSPPLKANEFIQFSKYQQPEPKDPEGIRFPMTIPISRNKINIKPRLNNDHPDGSLLSWMNVY